MPAHPSWAAWSVSAILPLRPHCVSLLKPLCFIHALVRTPSLCSRVLIPLTPVSLLSIWVFSITVLMPFYPLLLHRTLLITQFMHICGALISSLSNFSACAPVPVCFGPALSFSNVCEFLVSSVFLSYSSQYIFLVHRGCSQVFNVFVKALIACIRYFKNIIVAV